MSVVSALLIAAVVALLALAIGVALGAGLAPRLTERRQRRATAQSGITVSQMLAHIVSQSPVGIVVVDVYRDVVYTNDRARELGLVRDRLLDDRAWLAAERTLATGEDGEVDLSPRKRANPGRSGLSVRGHVRLLTEQDRRFAVVYVDDQSEHARMEATRRDFVANVSHELKTPVGAMGVLAEAVLASADDPETVRRFAEKMLVEASRLGNMVGRADRAFAAAGRRTAAGPRIRRRRHRGGRGAVALQGGGRQRPHRDHHRRADGLPRAR